MKNIAVCFFAIAMFLISCNENVSNPDVNLSILKVEYSGCFSTQGNSLKSETVQNTDSLYYSIDKELLSLHIDLVYNCCGILKDSAVIKNNVVSIYIYDSCLQNCLCKCTCLFKFNYSIPDFTQKTADFKVYLKSYGTKDYLIWKEMKGVISKQ